MAKFIIERVERYAIESDDPEITLKQFQVIFDNLDPEILPPDALTIRLDDFEYLDGKTSIIEYNTTNPKGQNK